MAVQRRDGASPDLVDDEPSFWAVSIESNHNPFPFRYDQANDKLHYEDKFTHAHNVDPEACPPEVAALGMGVFHYQLPDETSVMWLVMNTLSYEQIVLLLKSRVNKKAVTNAQVRFVQKLVHSDLPHFVRNPHGPDGNQERRTELRALLGNMLEVLPLTDDANRALIVEARADAEPLEEGGAADVVDRAIKEKFSFKNSKFAVASVSKPAVSEALAARMAAREETLQTKTRTGKPPPAAKERAIMKAQLGRAYADAFGMSLVWQGDYDQRAVEQEMLAWLREAISTVGLLRFGQDKELFVCIRAADLPKHIRWTLGVWKGVAPETVQESEIDSYMKWLKNPDMWWTKFVTSSDPDDKDAPARQLEHLAPLIFDPSISVPIVQNGQHRVLALKETRVDEAKEDPAVASYIGGGFRWTDIRDRSELSAALETRGWGIRIIDLDQVDRSESLMWSVRDNPAEPKQPDSPGDQLVKIFSWFKTEGEGFKQKKLANIDVFGKWIKTDLGLDVRKEQEVQNLWEILRHPKYHELLQDYLSVAGLRQKLQTTPWFAICRSRNITVVKAIFNEALNELHWVFHHDYTATTATTMSALDACKVAPKLNLKDIHAELLPSFYQEEWVLQLFAPDKPDTEQLGTLKMLTNDAVEAAHENPKLLFLHGSDLRGADDKQHRHRRPDFLGYLNNADYDMAMEALLRINPPVCLPVAQMGTDFNNLWLPLANGTIAFIIRLADPLAEFYAKTAPSDSFCYLQKLLAVLGLGGNPLTVQRAADVLGIEYANNRDAVKEYNDLRDDDITAITELVVDIVRWIRQVCESCGYDRESQIEHLKKALPANPGDEMRGRLSQAERYSVMVRMRTIPFLRKTLETLATTKFDRIRKRNFKVGVASVWRYAVEQDMADEFWKPADGRDPIDLQQGTFNKGWRQLIGNSFSGVLAKKSKKGEATKKADSIDTESGMIMVFGMSLALEKVLRKILHSRTTRTKTSTGEEPYDYAIHELSFESHHDYVLATQQALRMMETLHLASNWDSPASQPRSARPSPDPHAHVPYNPWRLKQGGQWYLVDEWAEKVEAHEIACLPHHHGQIRFVRLPQQTSTQDELFEHLEQSYYVNPQDPRYDELERSRALKRGAFKSDEKVRDSGSDHESVLDPNEIVGTLGKYSWTNPHNSTNMPPPSGDGGAWARFAMQIVQFDTPQAFWDTIKTLSKKDGEKAVAAEMKLRADVVTGIYKDATTKTKTFSLSAMRLSPLGITWNNLCEEFGDEAQQALVVRKPKTPKKPKATDQDSSASGTPSRSTTTTPKPQSKSKSKDKAALGDGLADLDADGATLDAHDESSAAEMDATGKHIGTESGSSLPAAGPGMQGRKRKAGPLPSASISGADNTLPQGSKRARRGPKP